MTNKQRKWRKLSSKIIHKNPFYLVKKEDVIKPDGSNGEYYVVENEVSVYIVAVDVDENIILIKTHRYPNDIISIEVPAGSSDGQCSVDAAKRELLEETGLTAKTWDFLGTIHSANNIIRGQGDIFLARNLAQTGNNEQAEEGIYGIQKASVKNIFEMIKNGEITDSETITALSLYKLKAEELQN